MEKTPSSRKSLLVIIQFFARVVGGRGVEVGVRAYLSLSGRGGGWGGRSFEAGSLLTFSALGWAGLMRGWALIRINTLFI